VAQVQERAPVHARQLVLERPGVQPAHLLDLLLLGGALRLYCSADGKHHAHELIEEREVPGVLGESAGFNGREAGVGDAWTGPGTCPRSWRPHRGRACVDAAAGASRAFRPRARGARSVPAGTEAGRARAAACCCPARPLHIGLDGLLRTAHRPQSLSLAFLSSSCGPAPQIRRASREFF
jgi:hypothetical protein